MLALHAEGRKWRAEAFPPQCRAACLADVFFQKGTWEQQSGVWFIQGARAVMSNPCPVPHTPVAGLASQRFSQATNPLCLHSCESLLTKPTHADSVAARGPYRTPAELVVVNLPERGSGQVNLRAALGSSFLQDRSYDFLHQPSVSCEKKGCEV